MANKVEWPGWEVSSLLGKGTFGAVYEIQREVFGHRETAALKVITIPQSESDIDELLSDGYDRESITTRYEGYLQDIVREYSMMADMKGCANIVYCDDVKYDQHENGIGWDIYIKMERLVALPKALGPAVTDEQVIKIGADICNALACCEKSNLLHRDIKPQNIFIAHDGTCKLGDFGIAKAAERTTSGTKTGTYKYMAPEVYHNQPYGGKADQYSLGLTLYWLLNERRTPFLPLPPEVPTAAMEDEARARRFSGEQLPPPAHGSPELQRIVLKACAFDPADRFQSAAEMQRALEALGGGVSGSLPVIPAESAAQPASAAEEATAAVFLRDGGQSETAPSAEPQPQEPAEQVHEPAEQVQEPAERTEAEATSYAYAAPQVVQKPKQQLPRQTAVPRKRRRGWIAAAIAAVLALAAVAVYFLLPRYGAWSEWSAEKPEDVSGRKIETAQGYRYRDREEKTTTDKDAVEGEIKDEREEYSDWSDWSEWIEQTSDAYILSGADAEKLAAELGEAAVLSAEGTLTLQADDTTEIESEVRFRSREKTTTTAYSDWSGWSAWTTNPAAKSDTVEVQTKTAYRYPAHGYVCNSCGAVFGSIAINCVSHVNKAHGQSGEDLYSVLKGHGTEAEYNATVAKYFTYVNTTLSSDSANAYPTGKSPEGYVVGSPTAVTMYSTRSRTMQEEVQYSDWSDWSAGEIAASDTVEVESKQVWRYRTRQMETVYTYDVWSAWSKWSVEVVQASDDREVETKSVYRYQDRI